METSGRQDKILKISQRNRGSSLEGAETRFRGPRVPAGLKDLVWLENWKMSFAACRAVFLLGFRREFFGAKLSI